MNLFLKVISASTLLNVQMRMIPVTLKWIHDIKGTSVWSLLREHLKQFFRIKKKNVSNYFLFENRCLYTIDLLYTYILYTSIYINISCIHTLIYNRCLYKIDHNLNRDIVAFVFWAIGEDCWNLHQFYLDLNFQSRQSEKYIFKL